MSSMQIRSSNEYNETSSINQPKVSLPLYKSLQKSLLAYCGILLSMLETGQRRHCRWNQFIKCYDWFRGKAGWSHQHCCFYTCRAA